MWYWQQNETLVSVRKFMCMCYAAKKNSEKGIRQDCNQEQKRD